MTDTQPCPSCGRLNRLPIGGLGTPRCAVCKATLPWLVKTSDSGFDTAIVAKTPVLVDFSAVWCAPCRAMEPLIEQLATELKGKLKVVKVDVDEAPVVSSRFGIRSVPTFVVFVDGKETARAVGAVPLERLRSLVATV